MCYYSSFFIFNVVVTSVYVCEALMICAVLTCFGMTFLILACAVPTPKIFYPFFVLIFYVLAVIPVIISSRSTQLSHTSQKSEFAFFLTAGMIVSAFALPIVLAHSRVIVWSASILTLIANVINFLTIFGYAFYQVDDMGGSYGGMF